MSMSVQCLGSGNSESGVYGVSGKSSVSSEIRETNASNVNSVSCVNSVNCANSVSSLGGGATSVSDGIFTFRSIITQVADTWRKQEENQAKVGFTNYSATDGQPSHTLLGTIVAFHFSDH